MKSRDEKGFTLVELMVAVLVGLILMAGVFALYRNTQETYISQEKLVEAQQNTRILLDQLSREFRLAGYVASCAEPAYASPTGFQFEADTDFDGTAERIYFQYIDDSSDPDYKTLFRASDTNSGTCAQMGSPEFVAVATDLEDVHFDYYDTNNGLLDPGGGILNATQLADVRRVTIRVRDEVLDLATNQTRVVSLISDIRLRNEGVADTGGCASPGAVSGFNVTDIKVCNRVKATWTPNGASDGVTTYRLYTRLAGTASWLQIEDVGVVQEYTKSTGLVNGSSYEIAIAAKNDCALSELSTPVTVGPLDDDIGPDPATALTGSAATNGNTVDLSWTASVTRNFEGNEVTPNDISGYNVWRSDDGGANWFGPINGSLLTVTNFTDTVPVACEVYYYKIQTADTCGNMSAFSAVVGGDGPPPTGDTDDTRPEETVAPSAPGGFVAVAGGKYGGVNNYRVGLSWQFPADVDTEGVRILYKQNNTACVAADYPTDATGNTFLTDETGDPSSTFSENYDVFSNNKYYCFTAFSYDACGNYSTGAAATAQAKTCGDDPAGVPAAIDLNSLDVDRDAFKSPATVGVTDVSNEHRGRASLTWTTTQNTTNTPDLVGFNVFRRPAPDDYGKSISYNSKTFYGLADAPTFFPSGFTPQFTDSLDSTYNTCVGWGSDGTTDTTASGDDLADATGINAGPNKICESVLNDTPVGTADDVVPAISGVTIGSTQDPSKTRKLLPGEIYEYVVSVVDCSEQNSIIQESMFVAPGKLTRNTSVSATTSGTKSNQNNIVNFSVRNTSASAMTIRAGTDPMTITWTNSNARLTKVELGGTTLWEDASANPATTSGTALTLTTSKTIAAAAWNEAMKLTFKKTDGNTNIDMRGSTVTVNLSFRNDLAFSQATSEFESTVTHSFSLTASVGAAISDTQQNPPDDPDNPLLWATAKSSLAADVPAGWTVGGTSEVSVRATVTPQSGSTISAVRLYYYLDSAMLSDAPDPSVTPYTSIAMTTSGGNIYETPALSPIPTSPGERVWYYLEAVDSKGRTSTSPDQSETVFIAYTYDQELKTFSPTGVKASWNPDVPCPSPDSLYSTGTVLDSELVPVSGADIEIQADDIFSNSVTDNQVTDASGVFTDISALLFTGDTTVQITISKADFETMVCSPVVIPFLGCVNEMPIACN